MGPFTINDIINSIVQGVLITGTAVLGNQLYKQMHKDLPFFSIAELGNEDQRGDYYITNNENIDDISLGQIDNERGMNMPVKIYLDAGHGGNSPGAVYNSYKEKDLNLEAVLYIGKRLTELGAEVGYSRTTDINAGEVFSRGVKAKGYNYFLSIHCNAGGGNGAEIIANCKETGAMVESYYKEALSKLGKFRKIYSRKYSNGAIIERSIVNGSYTNIVDDLDWYGVLRGCWSVGVSGNIIEMFFLDNINDLNNYLMNKQAFWEAIIKSICLTFGIEYHEANGSNNGNNEVFQVSSEELQNEIETLRQTIQLKDNQIRALQSELAKFVPTNLYERQE